MSSEVDLQFGSVVFVVCLDATVERADPCLILPEPDLVPPRYEQIEKTTSDQHSQ
jgi:hypothetical protein